MSQRFANKIAIGMTRVMAVDLAQHNIRVNTVAPGTVATERIKQSHNDERREAWLRSIPLARYGEPEEMAAAALFFASDDAGYITGQTIAVDGGFTIAGLRVKNLCGERRVLLAAVAAILAAQSSRSPRRNPSK